MHPTGSDADDRHRVLKRTMRLYFALATWPFLIAAATYINTELIFDGVISDNRNTAALYLIFLSSVVASTAVVSGRRITRRSRGLRVMGWLGLLLWGFIGFVTLGPDCS